MMTVEDHRQMFAQLRDSVKGYFEVKETGQMCPMAYKIEDNGMSVYVIAGMKDDKEKEAISELMVKMVDEGAEAVAMVAESWTLPEEYFDTLRLYPSISENPHRVECMSFYYSTKWGDWIAMASIIRSDDDPWGIGFDGVKPKLGDWIVHDEEFGTADGRFTQLWHRARALHAAEN